jgi:crotonobetaine/carnitine-CoA ligase
MAEAVKQTTPRVLRGRDLELGPFATRYPQQERNVVRLLWDQADALGDRPWLVFDGVETLTYEAARRLTNQVANAILATVGPSKHVGLYLRNQIEFLPAELGALAVGVAVPLNADARGPLLQSQIERADVSLLIVRSEMQAWIAALPSLGQTELIVVVGEGDVPKTMAGVPVVHWDDWIAGQPETLDHPLAPWDALAAIAFTSGTTGRAKGVMHTHSYWYLFSANISDSLGHTEDEVLTSPLPLYHGGALHLVAMAALHAGAVGHLQARFSPKRFWADAARDGATYTFLLGPVAALIDKATPADAVPEHRLERVYCLPSPPDRPAWEAKFRTRVLRQGWAMTEVFPCLMRDEQLEGVPEDSMGWPASWFDYAVLDEDDNMVAPGVPGELAWRCNIPYGMFSGYYKEPQITLDAFRNQWFHTGDAATYDEDGMLRFAGRLKDRIRRRGEMVVAGDIEHVVTLHEKVQEAAAYGVPEELGEEDIKLDIVLKEQISAQELHAWLVQNLPKYMIPRYLEFRDEFPKTPSQRIEKYKLKADPVDRPEVFDAGTGRPAPAA